MNCSCCYCGEEQDVPAPPGLVDCKKCGRPFRVFFNYSGAKIDLGKDAKKFFEVSPARGIA